jgi:predicted DNA-binding transcriptional regulator
MKTGVECDIETSLAKRDHMACAVAMILAFVTWIGYTMATMPPPEPIEFEESPPTSDVTRALAIK